MSKLDLRARRSRQLLQAAFWELLQTQPYAQVSITAIADRAGVARPTFYLHYASKEALLLSYLDPVFAQFSSEIDTYLEGEAIAEPAGAHIFAQLGAHAAWVQVVMDAGVEAQVLKRFQHYVLQVLQRFLRKNQHAFPPAEVLAFTADYLAGASWALIASWVKNQLHPEPAIMGRVYYELIQPGLTQVLVHGTLNETFHA